MAPIAYEGFRKLAHALAEKHKASFIIVDLGPDAGEGGCGGSDGICLTFCCDKPSSLGLKLTFCSAQPQPWDIKPHKMYTFWKAQVGSGPRVAVLSLKAPDASDV